MGDSQVPGERVMKDAIARVIGGADLTREEAASAMEVIMTGQATPAQIGAFLVALRLKGETFEEIAGCAEVMRRHAAAVKASGVLVDTCGTGGDEKGTFNISTAAAFVAAGAGVKIAKHGNRSVSSKSGSADVLMALGVNVDAEVRVVERCIEEAGIGFLFAPRLHAAMKHAIGPRREIGIRTVFNILGPLTNPAGATRQLMGVFAPELTEKLGEVLARLGTERALVVCGEDGLDELSTMAPSRVTWVEGESVRTLTLDAADLGFARAGLDELRVGNADQSAAVIRRVLDGASGPARDIVLLNAAGAVIAAGKADDWPAAVEIASLAVDSGAARDALARLVAVSGGSR